MIKVGKMVFVLFESGLDSAALSDNNNNNRPASNEAKWTTQCGTGKVMVQRSSSRAVTFGGGLAVGELWVVVSVALRPLSSCLPANYRNRAAISGKRRGGNANG